jgi:polysaccharide biosynthesis transport protein
MSLRQFLLALRARRWVFGVALATVVLAAVLASLVMPKSYRATVSLLVDADDQQSQQSLGQVVRLQLGAEEHMNYLRTQADILTSPKVAREVVEQLQLTQNPTALRLFGVKASRNAPVEEELIEALLHNLKVEASQSSVIKATFTCGDPRWAAAIANSFASTYVHTVLELRVAPTRDAAVWFDEQLKGLRANVEQAQRQLRAGVGAAQVKLAQHPESLPQVRDNAFIQQLRSELQQEEAKLEGLSTRYGVNHPLYQSQVSEIRALRARLQTEIHRIVTATAEGQGAGTLAAAQPALGGAEPAADPRTDLLVPPVLRENVDSAERAYDAALQRYFATQIESRASQTNVGVLSPAVAPLRWYRPNLELNVALALVTGIALGLALIAFLETQDARVRSVEDLSVALGLPLLAVLSDETRPAGLLPRPETRALRALPRPS